MNSFGLTTAHIEKHFTGSDTVRDIVIGMSDGLTVPFALAAGLVGAVARTNIIVLAGFAEIAAGSIAMGLGGYLAAKSDAEHYESEKKREEKEVIEIPEAEAAEVRDILKKYGLKDDESKPIIDAFRERPADWVDFMMKFELGLEEPDPKRGLRICSHHCRFLYCRWIHSSCPIYNYAHSHICFYFLYNYHSHCPCSIRLCEKFIHRSQSISQAIQTVVIGGLSRLSCLPPRQSNKLIKF